MDQPNIPPLPESAVCPPAIQPPASDAEIARKNTLLQQTATGQKLVIYAILVYIAAIIATQVFPQFVKPFGIILLIGIAAMSLTGIIKLASGLEYSTVATVLLALGSFIPLVGLLILLMLNGKATAALKAAGYKVGLLGASGIPAGVKSGQS